jgi:hypothetical protein
MAHGRISATKRRHGLTRCRYKGESGMKRWVGLGAISDNLIRSGNTQTISVVTSPSTHIRFFLNDPAGGARRRRFFCATLSATSIGIAIRKDVNFAPES